MLGSTTKECTEILEFEGIIFHGGRRVFKLLRKLTVLMCVCSNEYAFHSKTSIGKFFGANKLYRV